MLALMNFRTPWTLLLSIMLPIAQFEAATDQFVSVCHPVAETLQREVGVTSAFDGTNFIVALRGSGTNRDAAGAQLLSPKGDLVGSFVDTGCTITGLHSAPGATFGSGNYLMVWTDGALIWR